MILLLISVVQSYRNFTNAPPEMPEDFKFNLDDWIPVALAALEHDSDLNKARFTLVPKVISEETFWKTYFFRVFIIKRAYNIPMNPSNTAGSSTEKPDSSTSSDVATSEQQKQQSTSPIPGLLRAPFPIRKKILANYVQKNLHRVQQKLKLKINRIQ